MKGAYKRVIIPGLKNLSKEQIGEEYIITILQLHDREHSGQTLAGILAQAYYDKPVNREDELINRFVRIICALKKDFPYMNSDQKRCGDYHVMHNTIEAICGGIPRQYKKVGCSRVTGNVW
jgi:hypothetical protein